MTLLTEAIARKPGSRILRFAAVISTALLPGTALAGIYGSDYQAKGNCGPFPKIQVTTPDYACVGIVAGPDHGLKFPRSLVVTPGGRMFIADMGGWGKRRGRILELIRASDNQIRLKTLFDRIDRPHGLAIGPDGLVYVGEPAAIWRFDPRVTHPARSPVVNGLPDGGRHPLSQFVFDSRGNLIVNVGAPSDRCRSGKHRDKKAPWPCPAVTGKRPQAAVWIARLKWPGGTLVKLEPLARGLRNSMALAVHPKSGLILQAENSIDFAGEHNPPEELNVILPGGHYGWPYCTGRNVVSPGYRSRGISCARYGHPQVLLPAHAAPLGMAYYRGALFPELAGRLIVSFHGYRTNGHRLVAIDTDKRGVPLTPPDRAGGRPGFGLRLIAGWRARKNVRPKGAPVGLALTHSGAIWFVEDKNRTVMALLRNSGDAAETFDPDKRRAQRLARFPPPQGWPQLYKDVLKPSCARCHGIFKWQSSTENWARLVQIGWISPEDLPGSKLFKRMTKQGPGKPMPMPRGFRNGSAEMTAIRAFIKSHQAR